MPSFIIHEVEQGSEDWFRARAGKITASMFSTARSKVNTLNEQQKLYVDAILSGKTEAQAMGIAKYRKKPSSLAVTKALAGEKVGEWSEAALNYAFRLAVERISGEPLDEGFQTWAMRRGHELEPEARMEHEVQTGVFVQSVGVVTTPDECFAASADGFIGDDEGVEYKCFISPEKLRAFWFDDDYSEVIEQCQGAMWITGRKRWHIGLYCPALRSAGKQLWLKVIDRDDDYIEEMEKDLWEFKLLVDEYERRLRS